MAFCKFGGKLAAHSLGIKYSTLKRTLSNLYIKTGTSSAHELAYKLWGPKE